MRPARDRAMSPSNLVFGLATCARPVLDVAGPTALYATAAEVVSRAVVHAVLTAETATTPAGTFRSYREVAAIRG
jgi:putative pantetheine hydrolase